MIKYFDNSIRLTEQPEAATWRIKREIAAFFVGRKTMSIAGLMIIAGVIFNGPVATSSFVMLLFVMGVAAAATTRSSTIDVDDLRGIPTGDRLLTRAEVAERYQVSISTLEAWAARGIGPKFVRFTARCVRFFESEVNNWVRDRVNSPETEEGEESPKH